MNRLLSPGLVLLFSAGLAFVCSGCGSDRPRSITAAAAVSSSSTPAAINSQVTFEVVIENTSDGTTLASPLSPGFWALHGGSTQAFASGTDAGAGLERLAEDGDPTELLAELGLDPAVATSGRLEATIPGGRQVIQVTAFPGQRLSLGSMLVASNDSIYALPEAGVELFDSNGAPLGTQVLTPVLYDAGTEVNEPLGAGRNQPARQAGPNTGGREGLIRPATTSPRALPRASRLVEVTVREDGGTLLVSLHNRSNEVGSATPFGPVYHALHQDGWELFQDGGAAPAGLETLAEDGSPADLLAATQNDPQVAFAAVHALSVQNPSAGPGPLRPGQTFELRLDPQGATRLSLASMFGRSNDWFLATAPGGVSLSDASGALRPVAEIEADLRRSLAIWDAGTEADQVPGAGSFQPGRQPQANTGPQDPDPTIRRVSDVTADLDAPLAGGVARVRVEALSGGQFALEVENTSAATDYTGVLSPVAWTLGDGSPLFVAGTRASRGLEALAEDGDAAAFVQGLPLGTPSGIANTAVGAAAPGPLMSGERYRFVVTPSAGASSLNLATMLVPSNDTFLSLGERGVALLDAAGNPRSEAAIQADLDAALMAWDAGTEANETGGLGPNQPPTQASPNTGPREGTGRVRAYDHALWTPPAAERMVRITIRAVPR